MLKKMMLMLAVICSMTWSVSAQEVTETLEKDLNNPQDLSNQKKSAELKEITKENTELVKEDKALLKNDTASDIDTNLNKDIAEDKAMANEEEPTTDTVENDNDSSWFGWLWPFGGDDKTTATADQDQPLTEELESQEVTATQNLESPEAITSNEPVTDIVEEKNEITPEEPVVEEETGSWFSWIWPFGGDKDDAIVANTDNEPATEGIAVTEGTEEPAVASTQEEGGVNVVNKLIYYFPNLFLNLIDSFNGSIGVGPKSGLELSMTKYAQFGGNYGSAYFVEKRIHRQYGGGYDNGYSLKIGSLVAEERYIDEGIGDTSFRIIKQPTLKKQHPTDLIYKNKYRDFWTVGIDAGWLVNFGLHFEPIEFADFITGIFFYDLCDDDLGRDIAPANENDSNMDEQAEAMDDLSTDMTEDAEVEEF